MTDTSADVVNMYTYDPFGNPFPTKVEESIDNLYRFAGYKWDPVTEMYPCYMRWYDPALYRFTGRDPVLGSFQEPLTLHAYIYCLNDPINFIDPTGEFSLPSLMTSQGLRSWMRTSKYALAAGRVWGFLKKIETGLTLLNACRSGIMNVINGPDSASDTAKFIGGFIGGAMQFQLGMHVNATIGGFAGSVFTSTYNEFISTSNLNINSLIRIGISTGIGSIMGSMGDLMKEGSTLTKLQLFLLGTDIDLITSAAFNTAKLFGWEWAGGSGEI